MWIGGEVLVKIGCLAEIHHEHFILRIAGLDQVHHGFVDSGALVPHRTGVVDDDPDCNRHVFPFERGDGFWLPILRNLEVVASQSRDRATHVIHYGRVQEDFLHLLLKNKPAVVLPGGRFGSDGGTRRLTVAGLYLRFFLLHRRRRWRGARGEIHWIVLRPQWQAQNNSYGCDHQQSAGKAEIRGAAHSHGSSVKAV